MKQILTLFILIIFLHAKKHSKKNKQDVMQPVMPLPDDLKQGEDFLQQSNKEFDELKKESANRHLKNQIINSTLDLEVPQLDEELEKEGLNPVRKLDIEIQNKDDTANVNANNNDKRKLDDDEEGEEDKIDDIEKRAYSIEDKIDHLLLHAGHDVNGHHPVWTPFGYSSMGKVDGHDSLNHSLKMIDYMHGGMMGGLGMHPYGMMGIGHANPLGYGLDHLYRYDVGMHFHNPYDYVMGLNHMHGMYSPYMYGGHAADYYGGLSAIYPSYHGYGTAGHYSPGHTFSQYRGELGQERWERHMRHQRDMDDILNGPLLPRSQVKAPQSSSIFLI